MRVDGRKRRRGEGGDGESKEQRRGKSTLTEVRSKTSTRPDPVERKLRRDLPSRARSEPKQSATRFILSLLRDGNRTQTHQDWQPTAVPAPNRSPSSKSCPSSPTESSPPSPPCPRLSPRSHPPRRVPTQQTKQQQTQSQLPTTRSSGPPSLLLSFPPLLRVLKLTSP